MDNFIEQKIRFYLDTVAVTVGAIGRQTDFFLGASIGYTDNE